MKNDEEKMTALRDAVKNERIDPQGEVADAVMAKIRAEKKKKAGFAGMAKKLIPIAAAFVLVCTIVPVIPKINEKSGSISNEAPANGNFSYSSEIKKSSGKEKSVEAEKRDVRDGDEICAEDEELPEEVDPMSPTEDLRHAPDTDMIDEAENDPKPIIQEQDGDGTRGTTYETTEETKSPDKTGAEETVSEEIGTELTEEPSADETEDPVTSGLTGRVGEALGIELYDDHLIVIGDLGIEEYEAFSAAIGKNWTKAEFSDLPAQVFGIGALDALKEAFAESGIGFPEGLEKYDDSYILVVTVR